MRLGTVRIGGGGGRVTVVAAEARRAGDAAAPRGRAGLILWHLLLKAVVLGGGIGGLTAALSLLAVGVEVQVFEQAPSFSEIGAGIQASPNSAWVLVHLGLADSLDAVGVRPDRLESRHWEDGRLLGTHEVNGDPPPYGAPHYLMHRADLLRTLVDALPEGVISLGRRAVSLEHDGDRRRSPSPTAARHRPMWSSPLTASIRS